MPLSHAVAMLFLISAAAILLRRLLIAQDERIARQSLARQLRHYYRLMRIQEGRCGEPQEKQ